MSLRLILTATAALAVAAPAFAAPAFAQTPAPAVAAAAAPTEEDVDAAATAFEADVEALTKELEAAKTAGGADKAKINTAADAIVAAHQPKANAFADLISAFLDTQPVPPEMKPMLTAKLDEIRQVPAAVRAQVIDGVAPAGDGHQH